jgi:hypothetical protein
MRTIEDIEADIITGDIRLNDAHINSDAGEIAFCEAGNARLEAELVAAITFGVPLADLKKLCEGWKDGRAPILPCKPGDTFYTLFEHEINERKCKGFYIDDATCKVLFKMGDINTSVYTHNFGKTWFLTRAEAEAALAGQKGEKE